MIYCGFNNTISYGLCYIETSIQIKPHPLDKFRPHPLGNFGHAYRLAHLGNNVLGVDATIEFQFLGDILEGDTRIRERYHSDSCLDDVVSETNDERECLLGLELSTVSVQSIIE